MRLRARAVEVDSAARTLVAAQTLAFLEQETADVNARIGELNYGIKQIPTYKIGPNVYYGSNSDQAAAYALLKGEVDQWVRYRDTVVAPMRDPLRRQPIPGLGRAIEAFESRAKVGFEAIDEVRRAVFATRVRYEELAADGEVSRALHQLDQPDLAPSPDFEGSIRELAAFEKAFGQKPTFTPPKRPSSNRPKN